MFSILQIFKESVYKVRTFLPLKLPPGILRHNVIAYLGAARYLDQEQWKIEEGFAAGQIYQMLVTYDSMDIWVIESEFRLRIHS